MYKAAAYRAGEYAPSQQSFTFLFSSISLTMKFLQQYLLSSTLLLTAAYARPAFDAEPAIQTNEVLAETVLSRMARVTHTSRKRQAARGKAEQKQIK